METVLAKTKGNVLRSFFFFFLNIDVYLLFIDKYILYLRYNFNL